MNAETAVADARSAAGEAQGAVSMDITPYLKLMVQKGASDLFLSNSATVKVKLEGKLQSVGKTVLTPELSKAAAYGLHGSWRRMISNTPYPSVTMYSEDLRNAIFVWNTTPFEQ